MARALPLRPKKVGLQDGKDARWQGELPAAGAAICPNAAAPAHASKMARRNPSRRSRHLSERRPCARKQDGKANFSGRGRILSECRLACAPRTERRAESRSPARHPPPRVVAAPPPRQHSQTRDACGRSAHRAAKEGGPTGCRPGRRRPLLAAAPPPFSRPARRGGPNPPPPPGPAARSGSWSPTPPAAAPTSWRAPWPRRSARPCRSRSWWRTAPAPPGWSAPRPWRGPNPTATPCSPWCPPM